jgi:hypothetical protein
MQKLLVYQSLWAMERRRPDGLEWSMDEKLNMIHKAGFDGCGVRFFDYKYAKEITDFLRADDLRPILEHVKELGADHINLQPDVRPYSIQECIPYIEGWRRLAHDAKIPVHIETHRDRMTTDLFFTMQLLDCFPDLRLTGDLSHYVVGREFAWPISEVNHGYMHRILDNCWGFHGRVASREQVQVQISFPHQKEWLDLFMGWWEYGLRSWRRRAPKDATFTFLCELGPKEYAMTGPDGYELSDRWQEAQMLKDMIRALWNKIEDEEKAATARAA